MHVYQVLNQWSGYWWEQYTNYLWKHVRSVIMQMANNFQPSKHMIILLFIATSLSVQIFLRTGTPISYFC